MKNPILFTILTTAVTAACATCRLDAQNCFISGLDNSFTFSASTCGSAGKTTTMATSGKTFKIITFYYEDCVVTAAEDEHGRRDVLFMDGKPSVPAADRKAYPKIGFGGDGELKTNEYSVGTHDFTDDGQPELVISVRSASGNGLAAYILGYISGRWACIGEMVTTGHNIRSCRVFRQTITIKDADSGILYTWTWHDGHFDFLSSDNSSDPSILISQDK